MNLPELIRHEIDEQAAKDEAHAERMIALLQNIPAGASITIPKYIKEK